MRQETLTYEEQAHYFGSVKGDALETLLDAAAAGEGLSDLEAHLQEAQSGFTGEDFLCAEVTELEKLRDSMRGDKKAILNDIIAKFATALESQRQQVEYAADEMKKARDLIRGVS